MSDDKPRTVHYTEMPDLPPESPLYTEWMTYRRELPRLLVEGHEQEFVLVKGTEIIGLFPSFLDAKAEGSRRFPRQSFLIQQILSEEPLIRLSPYCWPCRS